MSSVQKVFYPTEVDKEVLADKTRKTDYQRFSDGHFVVSYSAK